MEKKNSMYETFLRRFFLTAAGLLLAAAGLVFVFVALMACGAVIVGRASIRKLPDEFTEERHVEPEKPKGMEPEVMSGIGSGYCANCGSPLSPGDVFCSVCGKRL